MFGGKVNLVINLLPTETDVVILAKAKVKRWNWDGEVEDNISQK